MFGIANACMRRAMPARMQQSMPSIRSLVGVRFGVHGLAMRTFASARPTQQQLSPAQIELRSRNQSGMLYIASVIVGFIGLAYAAVPLYKIICTDTGLDGSAKNLSGGKFDPATMKPVVGAAPIRIRFNSSLSDSMKWKFSPQTKEITLVPGETALAFFTAENPTDEDIVGISTYSVVPGRAAQYFNKIQCFCFEEQKLAAHEEVDMPVFFYIDPEFAYDPYMKDIKEITLHYTFFRSKYQ
ncbi:UNVERIFIED_CONTAM: Cytochrome c oxidase assembly protein cox11, mitochondrial [Siphonaria sp. JEL0065]|nr:Cytochrome c oxidase assembly protein cox11, mitochondrial [Siphonaria sp. JEL0065]